MFKLLFSTVFLLYLSNVFPKSTELHFLHPFPLNPTPSDTNAHSRFLCSFFSNIVSSQIWLLKCSLFHNFPRLSLCPKRAVPYFAQKPEYKRNWEKSIIFPRWNVSSWSSKHKGIIFPAFYHWLIDQYSKSLSFPSHLHWFMGKVIWLAALWI